jgi:hypothetical protein
MPIPASNIPVRPKTTASQAIFPPLQRAPNSSLRSAGPTPSSLCLGRAALLCPETGSRTPQRTPSTTRVPLPATSPAPARDVLCP